MKQHSTTQAELMLPPEEIWAATGHQESALHATNGNRSAHRVRRSRFTRLLFHLLASAASLSPIEPQAPAKSPAPNAGFNLHGFTSSWDRCVTSSDESQDAATLNICCCQMETRCSQARNSSRVDGIMIMRFRINLQDKHLHCTSAYFNVSTIFTLIFTYFEAVPHGWWRCFADKHTYTCTVSNRGQPTCLPTYEHRSQSQKPSERPGEQLPPPAALGPGMSVAPCFRWVMPHMSPAHRSGWQSFLRCRSDGEKASELGCLFLASALTQADSKQFVVILTGGWLMACSHPAPV